LPTVIPTAKTNTKKVGVTNSLIQTSRKSVWAKLEEPYTKDLTNISSLWKIVIQVPNLPIVSVKMDTHLDLRKKLWLYYIIIKEVVWVLSENIVCVYIYIYIYIYVCVCVCVCVCV
jgi:hypothetical protein